jgi:hypothetical protein
MCVVKIPLLGPCQMERRVSKHQAPSFKETSKIKVQLDAGEVNRIEEEDEISWRAGSKLAQKSVSLRRQLGLTSRVAQSS